MSAFLRRTIIVVVIFLNFCEVYTHNLFQHDNAKTTSVNLEIEYYPDTHKFFEVLKRNPENDYRSVDRTDKPDQKDNDEPANLDSWSVIWYVASFGGLVLFFLVVSCSEWCCRRSARNNCSRNSTRTNQTLSDTPPPSYDQFAPPPYDSLYYDSNGEKNEFDVYVVPVHTFGTMIESSAVQEDSPPSYLSAANIGNEQFYPAYPAPTRTIQEATTYSTRNMET